MVETTQSKSTTSSIDFTTEPDKICTNFDELELKTELLRGIYGTHFKNDGIIDLN